MNLITRTCLRPPYSPLVEATKKKKKKKKLHTAALACKLVNPRRACARVTCVSVYPSVPALATSASVETSKQRYSRVSLRLFLDFDSWIFEKTFREKANMQMSWSSPGAVFRTFGTNEGQ